MPPRAIRIAFWITAIVLGGAQTWFVRHRIFSDGISYLAIAQHYTGGDWRGALNAYWSPLYSWLIAVCLLLFHASAYWQTSVLHAINFAAFLGSCFVFERFVEALIRLRPVADNGLSPRALMLAGYVAILHGGLLMVGTAYVSPDMIAFLLIGLAAWVVARIARGEARMVHFAVLGATLGVAYLDRAAFALLGPVYILAAALWLTRNRMHLAVCAASFLAVAAPFAVAISIKQGSFTTGESGKLNYGWEVNRAARWTHWQGEPGDIGAPVHPTRLILRDPVPVYEFGEPVAGSYPPWYDPSYWYRGIRPRFDAVRQFRTIFLNAGITLFFIATSPVFGILLLLAAVTGGRGLRPWRWPKAYWALIVPALAGIAMYCLIYADKRYIAGFFVVLLMTALLGVTIPDRRRERLANLSVQAASLLFAVIMTAWLAPQLATAAGDLARGRESEANVSWMLAQKFQELGVKPGDRIAYVGLGFEADWVRLAGAKIVAEAPVIHRREPGFKRLELMDNEYPEKFFRLDEASREKVYAAFRQAGAVIAVTQNLPPAMAGDWRRVLDPAAPGYPKSKAQTLFQSPAYYRWLEPRNGGGG